MPGSVANVLLIPQITSAYRGAMSKLFGLKPAKQKASVPVAPHMSST